jgi:D-glycero-D-manno-heptose 1,7-bisphosphate phosphatase
MTHAALFLDRDGIINLDLGYVHRPTDFIFRDGIFELCRAAQDAGLLLVVVTNQAGIGRGYYTEADFQALTRWMLARFAERGIGFAGLEYCPDHPVHGIGHYRRENRRRKPSPGMILDACTALGIDPARSIMVGDRATDMWAAHAAGVRQCILLPADTTEEKAVLPATTIIHRAGLTAREGYWVSRATWAGETKKKLFT